LVQQLAFNPGSSLGILQLT